MLVIIEAYIGMQWIYILIINYLFLEREVESTIIITVP